MTTIQRTRFISEMERRFRLRTPAMDANHLDPNSRVGRSEMCVWAREALGVEMGLAESVEPELAREIQDMWKRLKREFPKEDW